MNRYRGRSFFFRKHWKKLLIVIFCLFVYLGLSSINVYFAVAVSNSMAPTFVRGDVLIVKSDISIEDIREGDIIVYRLPNTGPICHRVVKKLPNNNFKTKGDASPADVYEVEAEWVEGKIMEYGGRPLIIPKIGLIRYPSEFKEFIGEKTGYVTQTIASYRSKIEKGLEARTKAFTILRSILSLRLRLKPLKW